MRAELTQARLKEVLRYDPETGVFTWVAHVGSSVIGESAGHVDGYGYQRIWLDDRRQSSHRMAFLYMTGALPDRQVDHVDGNRLNNAWVNLRQATDAQNRQNMAKKRGTKSSLQGVTWFERDQNWMSRITVNYKSHFLGYFPTEELAHAAYCEAKANLHTFQPTPRR